MTAPEPGYSFDIDPVRRFVRINLTGFWNADLLARYQADVRNLAAAAAATAAQSDAPSRVLIDMREHTLLSKDLATSLQAGLPPRGPDDRMAVIVANQGMLKHQVQRIASSREPHFFTVETEAMAWLFESDGAAPNDPPDTRRSG